MEVNLNIVKVGVFHFSPTFQFYAHVSSKATKSQSFGDTIDPHYLAGLVNALTTSLESGHGTTSLEVHGQVPLLALIYPLTYIHYYKLARWLGFLAAKKIRFVYEKYAATAVFLASDVVDKMTVWVCCCKAFLKSLITASPNKKIKYLPWGEETSRWTESEQIMNILVDDNNL